MNGISPRPRFFLQPEAQISATVASAVPVLPLVITDLIAEYTIEDYSQAAQPLSFDETGKLVESDENREIRAAITKALVSTYCDPAIKRRIFQHANEKPSIESNYAAILNSIFDEIRSNNEQINLDNVDFSNIHLVRLDLSGASMIGSKFKNCLVHITHLANADLTDAEISDSDFNLGTLTGASLVRSTIDNVIFSQIDMVRTDTTQAVYVNANFDCIAADGMITDDEALKAILDASAYDLDKMTADTDLDVFLKSRFLVHPKPQSNVITILSGQYSSTGKHEMNTSPKP